VRTAEGLPEGKVGQRHATLLASIRDRGMRNSLLLLACGASWLCRLRSVAGGFGNTSRVPILLLAMLALFSETARAETPTKLEGVVNLNTASPEELGLIPGIGPARVRNILAYRKAHPFRTVDELARIKGIGRKTVRKWRLNLAVGGPSTAQRVVRPEQPTVPPEQLAAMAKPALGAKPAVVARPAPRPGLRPLVPPRPALRRGETARALAVRAPGVSCLPPR